MLICFGLREYKNCYILCFIYIVREHTVLSMINLYRLMDKSWILNVLNEKLIFMAVIYEYIFKRENITSLSSIRFRAQNVIFIT